MPALASAWRIGRLERQPGDEQRHSEADPGDRADTDDVTPACIRRESTQSQPHGEPAERDDTDELADHQPQP